MKLVITGGVGFLRRAVDDGFDALVRACVETDLVLRGVHRCR